MARKQRVTRIIYGVFVLIVAAFTVSNIWQVARVVFVEPEVAAADPAHAPKVGAACGRAISEELRAIEHAREMAARETDPDVSRARYKTERSASLAQNASMNAACAADPYAADALAAVARLDRASETHTVTDVEELRAVRLGAQSFISGAQ